MQSFSSFVLNYLEIHFFIKIVSISQKQCVRKSRDSQIELTKGNIWFQKGRGRAGQIEAPDLSSQYQFKMMNIQNLKIRSKNSSSSSGSLKLINDHELEKKAFKMGPSKDLFDLLIEENSEFSNDEHVLRTISQMNLSPRQHPPQGCKCTKIDCLKMYCECFSKGRLCNQRCECYNCCNKEDCQLQIYKAQQIANFRHPGTFKGVPAFVPERRCTCKKSECRKNYCDCFRAGVKCTEQCECVMCQNGKPHNHDDFFDSRMEIEVNA